MAKGDEKEERTGKGGRANEAGPLAWRLHRSLGSDHSHMCTRGRGQERDGGKEEKGEREGERERKRESNHIAHLRFPLSLSGTICQVPTSSLYDRLAWLREGNDRGRRGFFEPGETKGLVPSWVFCEEERAQGEMVSGHACYVGKKGMNV